MDIHFKCVYMLAIGGALAITGCQATASGVSSTSSATAHIIQTDYIDTSYPNAKLIIGSKDLLGKIAIVQPRFRKAGQFSQAAVTVQNLTDKRYVLEYKTEWEDDEGFPVDANAMWYRFTMTPQQAQTFTSTGKTQEASKIEFTVRFPDDAFMEVDRQQ